MEFAKIFITLAALINPFGAIPAFIGLTQGNRPSNAAAPRVPPHWRPSSSSP